MLSANKAVLARIRDPIHGTICLSRPELALIDSPAFQRLRSIKQLGFADLAFPGATHTRYAHGLGAMHIASQMFDVIARAIDLDAESSTRLRSTVRLAALFHDVGHAPLSHAMEAFMPPVSALGLQSWQDGPLNRRASHEDYTLKILLDSDLTERIERRITDTCGATPLDIAALISGEVRADPARFVIGRQNWLPLLQQCVSSELDADRMDYLLRDSYFAGVPYGRYDHQWILENLVPVEQDEALFLGLDARASFGFEDFLLSRYHMFTSVYLHQIPIAYEVMLAAYVLEQTGELAVPADIASYLAFDDVALFSTLRRSENRWAKRIVGRHAYRMLVETKAFDRATATTRGPSDLAELMDVLLAQRIDARVHRSTGELSKYWRPSSSSSGETRPRTPTFFIVEGAKSIPVSQYTPLYERYAEPVYFHRIYVDPERHDDAKRILEKHSQRS